MIDCPVCERKNIEDNKCPQCDADLTPLLRLMELPEAYYVEGVRLAKQGQLDKAIEKLMTAISLNSVSTVSYLTLGKIYIQKELYDEAMVQYNKVLEFDPGNEEAKKSKEGVEKLKIKSKGIHTKEIHRITTLKKLLIGVPIVAFLIGLAVLPISRSLFQQNPKENYSDIAEHIKKNITNYPVLAGLNIETSYQDNMFIISGEVPTDLHKDLITEIASNLVGKTQLDLNNLRKQDQDISLMAKTTEGKIPIYQELPELSVEVNNIATVEQIKQNFAGYSDLADLKIDVIHEDEEIIISGEIPTNLHKDLIITLAKNVAGTNSINTQNLSITSETPISKKEPDILYTIKPGDTLSSISYTFYGDSQMWNKIYEVNTDKIDFPHQIFVGDVLIIPNKGNFNIIKEIRR